MTLFACLAGSGKGSLQSLTLWLSPDLGSFLSINFGSQTYTARVLVHWGSLINHASSANPYAMRFSFHVTKRYSSCSTIFIALHSPSPSFLYRRSIAPTFSMVPVSVKFLVKSLRMLGFLFAFPWSRYQYCGSFLYSVMKNHRTTATTAFPFAE